MYRRCLAAGLYRIHTRLSGGAAHKIRIFHSFFDLISRRQVILGIDGEA